MSYITMNHNNTTSYIVPLNAMNAFLDFSGIAKNAIRRDREVLDRKNETGPNFAIEVHKAMEYVNYVRQYATEENLHKFDTRDYMFFFDNKLGSET